MAFSNIAIEQREKEEKALRSSLALYLIGSVVLHIVVLVIGVIVPWNRGLAPEDEPIEVTVVEPLESPKVPEPKEETQSAVPPQRIPLQQPESTETSPPEKVEERPEPTETKKTVKEKPVSTPAPAPNAPVSQAAQNNRSAETTAKEAPLEGLTNPFERLLGSGAGGSGQRTGSGAETETGTGTDSGAGGSDQGAVMGVGAGTGTGSGIGFGTGSGQGTGTGTGTGTGSDSGAEGSGQGTGTGTGIGFGTGPGGGGRTGASITDHVSLEGVKQEVTAVVRDGKVVDLKFQSTGDPELDKQIKRQLDKFKKKVRLPSNAKKDGEIRANVNFKGGEGLERSRQAQQHLERQARERRDQKARQSGGSTTSAVIQQGVDVPAASSTSRSNSRTSTSSTTQKSSTGRSGSTTSTPTSRSSTPVRRTRVRRTQSTPTSTSEQSTPSSTPVKRVRVRRTPSASTPGQKAPSTTGPANTSTNESE